MIPRRNANIGDAKFKTWLFPAVSLVDPSYQIPRLVPSRYLSVFWDERRLGIRLRRARGVMGREEGKIAIFLTPSTVEPRYNEFLNLRSGFFWYPSNSKTYGKEPRPILLITRMISNGNHTCDFKSNLCCGIVQF